MKRSSRNDNRWSSAVVTNRDVSPVRHQSVFFASEHDSNVRCMMNRRVKISVVSDFRWHMHLGSRLGNQERRDFLLWSLSQEILLKSFPHSRPDGAAHRHEIVQYRLLESGWQWRIDSGPDRFIDGGQIWYFIQWKFRVNRLPRICSPIATPILCVGLSQVEKTP